MFHRDADNISRVQRPRDQHLCTRCYKLPPLTLQTLGSDATKRGYHIGWRYYKTHSADFLTEMHPYFRSGGELRFKTDHLEYFETVTEILQKLENYKIVEHTTDLHLSDYNENNMLTEFEMLFKSKGNPPIRYLLAETL